MSKNRLIEKVKNKALTLGLMSLALENVSASEIKDNENFEKKNVHHESIEAKQDIFVNQGDSIFTETQKKMSQHYSAEGLTENNSTSSTKRYLLGDGYEMVSSYNEEFSNSTKSEAEHSLKENLQLKTPDNRMVDCSGLFSGGFISSHITYHSQDGQQVQYSPDEVKKHNDNCMKKIKITAMQKLSNEDYPYFMKFVQDRRENMENLSKEKTVSIQKINEQNYIKDSSLER